MIVNTLLSTSTFPIKITKPTQTPTPAFPSFHNTISTTPPPPTTLPSLSIRRYCSVSQQLLPLTTTDSLLLYQQPEYDEDFQLHLLEPLLENNGNEEDKILVNHRFVSHPYPGDDSSYVIGSCNGLVCFTDGHYHNAPIHVCNPVTGEYVTLPPNDDDDDKDGYNITDGVQFGFGFDHITKHYKFFRMFMDSNHECVAQVNTLGASQEWRTLETPPYSPYEFYTKQIYVDGSFHWMVEGQYVIMSFHVGTEDYDFLPFSSELVAACKASTSYHLMELGGYLGIMDSTFSDRIEIWIMKEYGEQDSWTKQFVIPRAFDLNGSLSYLQPITLMKKGNLLLQAIFRDGYDLARYDPVTKTIRNNLGLHKSPCKDHWYDVIPHSRSSVSLKDIVGHWSN